MIGFYQLELLAKVVGHHKTCSMKRNKICKGSLALGNACGDCTKCYTEKIEILEKQNIMTISQTAYLCTTDDDVTEHEPRVFVDRQLAIDFCKENPEYGWVHCRLST